MKKLFIILFFMFFSNYVSCGQITITLKKVNEKLKTHEREIADLKKQIHSLKKSEKNN